MAEIMFFAQIFRRALYGFGKIFKINVGFIKLLAQAAHFKLRRNDGLAAVDPFVKIAITAKAGNFYPEIVFIIYFWVT